MTPALALLAATAFSAAPWWDAPDRGAKVAALIPGRGLADLTPDNLYADWTREQVARWAKEHPGPLPGPDQLAAAAPADAELVAGFPRHIAPFGHLRAGQVDPADAANVLITYCLFCGSRSYALSYDPQNPYHGTTTCCHTELFGHPADAPADYPLKPNASAKFLHLDDTWVEVPSTLYRDQRGAEWELFIQTIFDQKRWLDVGCSLVEQEALKFEQTADPVHVHKIAVRLDQVADTYYGLPLCGGNELCLGKDGQPLTRAEWEAVPRPAIFAVSYLGPWNRRVPLGSRGWINMFREQLWVLPFAKVRHHPAFKAYSQARYGDPEALDRKVRTKLLREIDLMFQSVFSQKLLTNYQEANYVEMWLLGVLLEDPVLRDFAGPNAELTLYNHTYQDGLNGEGAPNYMAMPGGYFYPFLRDPKGFGFYYPKFLEEHPFSAAAATEMRRLNTVRGVDLEFGDQHEMAFPPAFTTDPAAVRANELVGSRNWAGYGVGVLRVGGPGHRQEVGLSYTRCSLHNAQDALSIECWVDGVPVLRRGGYAANWHNAPLQWERPEYQALRKMDYPHPIEEGEAGFGGWSWVYAHSPLCQNGATVDDVATGRGWGDNRGYGEVICFKGGEPEGEPGSGFQVLDVRDHYSWSRVGKPVREFRRTLIGIEGPDGRPYVLDLLKLSGGNRHTLYTSAWAERAAATLPAPTAKADDLAARLFRDRPPEDTPDYRIYRHVRQVAAAPAPAAPWEVTWRTDVAAYAARDAAGKPFQRPIPDDVGRVRLRLVGIETAPGGTELISAKGPWIAWLRQPLPGGQRADGNVSFVDARDFVIERRTAAAGDEGLVSVYCHVLEGYREGEASMIRSVKPLAVTSLTGGERDVVALELAMAGGHTDTVIYQSDDGTIRLPDGLETDARYALVRRDAQGQVTAADAVRGTSLRAGSYRAGLAGDFTGTIVDVIGDLTGTRRESALVIRPDRPWPAGEDLRDRQLLVRVESGLRDPCNEGWRVAGVAALPDGLVRVDVQDHAPFATSWHQVIEMPADRPSVLRTHRPMVDHGNSPWYNGLSLWLPERGKLYTIKRTNEVGGGLGGDTVELDGAADPAADGVTVGDWYVIHAVRPGLRVAVANDFAWRTEPARDWRQHALRATGPVSLECPVTRSSLAWRAGDGAWQTAPNGQTSFAATGGAVRIIAGQPAWLNLDDSTPPQVAGVELDGRELTPDAARDLGWIDPPARLTVRLRDRENPLDPAALAVTLNGQPTVATSQAEEGGKGLTVTLDLATLLAADRARPRRQRIEIAVADRSVARHRTVVAVSFINRVPLEEGVVYLSDLKPARAFAHGGLILDRDYVGNMAEIQGRVYPKGLTLCPEAPAGWAEVVYALPPDRPDPLFLAEVGLTESSRGAGSATFLVQRGPAADGPWETLYTSPTLRGGMAPVAVELRLGGAKYLRLYTTDAGDGINSDHAFYGAARLR